MPGSPRSTSTPGTEGAGAESRQLILDTAARLFRHDGYASTTLRAIAGQCGMQAGSLYYHFSSKDEIVTAVLDIGVQRVFDAVRHAVEALPPDADLRTILHAAIEAHLGALLLAHDFTSANIRIFGQVPPHVRDAHMAIRRRYERFWRTLLGDLRARGLIRPDVGLVRTVFFLFGALNWTTEWHDEGKSGVAVVATDLADLITRGLQADTSSQKGTR